MPVVVPTISITPSDPKNMVQQMPCLKCLSTKELLIVGILALAEVDGTYTLPADTNKLVADSACYTCLTDTQLLQLIVLGLGKNGFSASDTLATVRAKLKCLECADPAQVKGAFTYLLLKTLESALPV